LKQNGGNVSYYDFSALHFDKYRFALNKA